MTAEHERDTVPRRSADAPVRADGRGSVEPAAGPTPPIPSGHPIPPGPPVAAAPVKRGRWTDLDLNGSVPPRATPMLGDWGPEGVPSTGEKARQRWLVPVVFGVMVLVVAFTWHYFWLRLG